MKRKERSGSRSIDEIRKHKKLIDLFAVNQENLQKVMNLDIRAITRGINILWLKKNYIYKYN